MQTTFLTSYKRIPDCKDSENGKKNLKMIMKSIVHILTQHGFYTYNKHAVIERYTIFRKEQSGEREKENNTKR